MLEKYKENIKIVLCGHVHNNISSNIAGIPVIATFSNVFSYNLKFETTELCRRNFSSSSFHLHYFNGENFISYTIPFEEE